jgi:4-amino-4-deoxy-L-arabinose transferase-like glycosyltransferase
MIAVAAGRRWFWCTIGVALFVRLWTAFCVQLLVSHTHGRLCLIPGDAEGYWELAGRIAAFQDYSIYDPPRHVLRMPGFPFLLALSRFCFENNPFAVRFVLAFVGTLGCGLVYWLGRELVSETVGLIAAAYTAISPTMVLFSVLFLSETAFAMALLASLVAAAKLARIEPSPISRRSIGLALLTGLLIGVATYMRPTWILVGPGIGVCLIVFGRAPIGRRFCFAALVCLGLGVSLAPWTIRNLYVVGHAVPTTLWVGPSLYDGLNPTATGDSDMEFFERDQLMARMSEYEMDREYRARAWKFAVENPQRVATLALVKQFRFWSPVPNSTQFQFFGVAAIAWLVFLPLMFFATIGAWYSRRDSWLFILTIAPLIYFAVLHLFFVGSLRYRLPAEYPLAVMAAFGFCRCSLLWGTGSDDTGPPEAVNSI